MVKLHERMRTCSKANMKIQDLISTGFTACTNTEEVQRYEYFVGMELISFLNV